MLLLIISSLVSYGVLLLTTPCQLDRSQLQMGCTVSVHRCILLHEDCNKLL